MLTGAEVERGVWGDPTKIGEKKNLVYFLENYCNI